MDDHWLVMLADSMLKSFDAWETFYKIEPADWEFEDYQTVACIAQQLVCEREDALYRKLRNQVKRKRSANRANR